jgi:CRISP-associated protein Cas1
MSALPSLPLDGRQLPEYLPARMANEYAYCPRLFFYEWVEGLFRHSVDTIEGSIPHEKIDKKSTAMPTPEEAADGEKIRSRSLTLSSERLRVIAKLDLAEGSGCDAGGLQARRVPPTIYPAVPL